MIASISSFARSRTETSPPALICYWGADETGSIGLPMPELEAKLVPVAPKLEVRFRGPNITPGYYRDQEKTREATDRYRDRFPVAEAWRLETIRKVQADGYIMLPDGHRRSRFEATDTWHRFFLQQFLMNRQGFEGFDNAIRYIAAKIQKRAYNQAVNAMIQGACATLAKRSQLRVDRKIREEGFTARFLMPIHDELLWSVHRREVVEFIEMARGVMIAHPDLYRNCALDASPAIGLTFEPWHAEKAPIGQIELFEAPKIPTVAAERVGKRRTADEARASVDYLFDLRDSRRRLAA